MIVKGDNMGGGGGSTGQDLIHSVVTNTIYN